MCTPIVNIHNVTLWSCPINNGCFNGMGDFKSSVPLSQSNNTIVLNIDNNTFTFANASVNISESVFVNTSEIRHNASENISEGVFVNTSEIRHNTSETPTNWSIFHVELQGVHNISVSTSNISVSTSPSKGVSSPASPSPAGVSSPASKGVSSPASPSPAGVSSPASKGVPSPKGVSSTTPSTGYSNISNTSGFNETNTQEIVQGFDVFHLGWIIPLCLLAFVFIYVKYFSRRRVQNMWLPTLNIIQRSISWPGNRPTQVNNELRRIQSEPTIDIVL